MSLNRSSIELNISDKKTPAVKRIAFFGGAFDPPHCGHEMLARKALSLQLTDMVLWVPSWAPPHKTAGRMSDYHHRLAMVEIVAGKIPGCKVSDIESRKQFDPSYSYKVMNALQEEYPDAELQLLIGEDSLTSLHTWYSARELVEKYPVIAFPRKSDTPEKSAVSLIPVDFWGVIQAEKLQKSLIKGEYVEISSTNLRKELAKNENMHHIINAELLEYIKKHGLYR